MLFLKPQGPTVGVVVSSTAKRLKDVVQSHTAQMILNSFIYLQYRSGTPKWWSDPQEDDIDENYQPRSIILS